MHFSSIIISTATLASTALAGYVLEDDYMAAGFFDQFDFWDDKDPTNGFVDYVPYQQALDAELISNTSSSIYMGVDKTNVTPKGRPSVRLESKKTYNRGLIVIDVEHMPGGICGTWPAFWTYSASRDWPNGGEIDIIEGVNDQVANLQTLHTGPGCTIADNGGFSGTITDSNCQSGDVEDRGCTIAASDSRSYGAGFNANGGGVYATEWTGSYISMWFFPRGSIPRDVLGDAPNPSSWGTPVATFQGGCDMRESFVDQQIVFTNTFCGDWAGNSWYTSQCAQKASTCNAYVQDNPAAFADAYWSVNALKVYKQGAAATASAFSEYGTATSIAATAPVSTEYVTATSIDYVKEPETEAISKSTASVSTEYVTATSIDYVNEPETEAVSKHATEAEKEAIPTYAPEHSTDTISKTFPTTTATTFAVSTKSLGSALAVDSSGSIDYPTATVSPAVPSSLGYIPAIPDVGTDDSRWSNAEAAEVENCRTPEDLAEYYEQEKTRKARHVGHHKRHGAGKR